MNKEIVKQALDEALEYVFYKQVIMNALTAKNEDDGEWITINGVHIFVKKGEPVNNAFKRATGKNLDNTKNKKNFKPYIPNHNRKPNPNFYYDEAKITELIKDIPETYISEEEAPAFRNPEKLLEKVREIFDKNRNITIKSDGEKILLSKNSAKRATQKQNSQDKKLNAVFVKIKETLENAKYYDFEPLNEGHEKDKDYKLGQYVYFSKIKIGTQPYRIRFKIDVPKYADGQLIYAGHRIKKI